jgi:predicted RNA-binding protein with PIN domain
VDYIIDGYNLLFRVSKSQKSLQKKREEFLLELDDEMAESKMRATIIFDGANDPIPGISKMTLDALEVIYTSEGLSADEYILEHLLTTRRKEQTVVTQDRALGKLARELGANTLGIQEFLDLLLKKRKRECKTDLHKTSHDGEREISRLLRIFEERLKSSN